MSVFRLGAPQQIPAGVSPPTIWAGCGSDGLGGPSDMPVIQSRCRSDDVLSSRKIDRYRAGVWDVVARVLSQLASLYPLFVFLQGLNLSIRFLDPGGGFRLKGRAAV